MSISVSRLEHKSVEYPDVEDYRDFFGRLHEIFGVEYNADCIYLPEEKEVKERIKREPKKFRDAVIKFGRANKWEADYWIGW